METLGQLKDIIKNAPDSATHIGSDFIYYQYEKADRVAVWREFTKHETSFVLSQCVCIFDLRSLSDIKLIIELMEWRERVFEAHPNIDLDMDWI